MNPDLDKHPTDEQINRAIAKRPDRDPELPRHIRRQYQRGGKHSPFDQRIQQLAAVPKGRRP